MCFTSINQNLDHLELLIMFVNIYREIVIHFSGQLKEQNIDSSMELPEKNGTARKENTSAGKGKNFLYKLQILQNEKNNKNY